MMMKLSMSKKSGNDALCAFNMQSTVTNFSMSFTHARCTCKLYTIVMNRIPSTQALQCFEASARLASFTLAGQELQLTQGGVSCQMIALEQRLGCALLD
jgi:hypothetical protein